MTRTTRTTRRILLIRFSSLGDCVLVSGLIGQIHKEQPDSVIGLAIKRRFADLYKNDPRVEILSFDSLGMHRGLLGVLRFSWQIRLWRPDVIVDLHGTLRARVLRLLLPLQSWQRMPKNSLRRRWQIRTRHFAAMQHITARMHAAWTGRPVADERPLRPRLIAAPQHKRSCIALVPGAAWPTKQWPVAHFVGLAQKLLEAGEAVCVLGGDAEATLSGHFDQLKNQFGEQLTLALANQPLDCLRDQLAGYALVVANDTGLMHMADAVGTPVVALFGPTAPRLGFAPQGEHARSLHTGIDCSPCTLHGHKICPRGHHRCMTDLTVDQVWHSVQSIRKENQQ